MNIEKLHTIGILGGMSSAATGEYYKLINQKVKEIRGGYTIAEILISSVNFANIEYFVRNDLWDEAGMYLGTKARQLELAGASCIFLGTNTMHRVRDQIKSTISIPFIDIFETTAQEIKKDKKKNIGILGTYTVMTDDFYKKSFSQYGISLISPLEEEKQEINRIIWDEMTNHQFLLSSKNYFIKVIQHLEERGAEGVILGCTEIKMLIHQTDVPNINLYDTTTLHCDLAAKICTDLIDPNIYLK